MGTPRDRKSSKYLNLQMGLSSELLLMFQKMNRKKICRQTHSSDNPKKNWKFSSADAKERGHWDDYMKAYEDMIRNTATKESPCMSFLLTTNGLLD